MPLFFIAVRSAILYFLPNNLYTIVPNKATAQIPIIILIYKYQPATIPIKNKTTITQNKIFPAFFIALF